MPGMADLSSKGSARSAYGVRGSHPRICRCVHALYAGSMPAPLAARLRAIAQQLADAGVPDPGVDAELLLGHVLGLGRGELQAAVIRGQEISDADAERLDA